MFQIYYINVLKYLNNLFYWKVLQFFTGNQVCIQTKILKCWCNQLKKVKLFIVKCFVVIKTELLYQLLRLKLLLLGFICEYICFIVVPIYFKIYIINIEVNHKTYHLIHLTFVKSKICDASIDLKKFLSFLFYLFLY